MRQHSHSSSLLYSLSQYHKLKTQRLSLASAYVLPTQFFIFTICSTPPTRHPLKWLDGTQSAYAVNSGRTMRLFLELQAYRQEHMACLARPRLLSASHRSTLRRPLIQGNPPGHFYISRSAKLISNFYTVQQVAKRSYFEVRANYCQREDWFLLTPISLRVFVWSHRGSAQVSLPAPQYSPLPRFQSSAFQSSALARR